MAQQTRTEAARIELIRAAYIAASHLDHLAGMDTMADPMTAAQKLIEQRRKEIDDLQRAMYELGTEQAIEERFGAQWTNS